MQGFARALSLAGEAEPIAGLIAITGQLHIAVELDDRSCGNPRTIQVAILSPSNEGLKPTYAEGLTNQVVFKDPLNKTRDSIRMVSPTLAGR